jgi:undecaprenyl phosphate N,N'-diacetylbacillosamine 1-phosphate transferase
MQKVIKEILDRIFSIIFLILLLPLFLLIALCIKLDSKGPVLFIQDRLGRGGRIFKMYKFRSMNEEAEDIRQEDGSTYNSEDDPRVTKAGRILRKTSLDELPQLINILKGEMSFVGPRPDLPDHYSLYTEYEKRKLSVKPGITGYAQALGRNSIPWKERIKLDIYYIDNYSLLFDFKILYLTVAAVLKKEGIYSGTESKADDVSGCGKTGNRCER